MIPLRPITTALMVALLTTGCTAKRSDPTSQPTITETADEPEEIIPEDPPTLDAAREANQEWWDRIGAGDYAAAWDALSPAHQKLVNKADYVAFNKACDKADAKANGISVRDLRYRYTVTDPRWVDKRVKTKATMTVQNLTIITAPPESDELVYQGGRWVPVPSAGFRKLGAELAKASPAAVAKKDCGG